MKEWKDLTDEEQWEQIKAERAIQRKYRHKLEMAEEDFEDGATISLRKVRAAVKAEINALRVKKGIAPR